MSLHIYSKIYAVVCIALILNITAAVTALDYPLTHAQIYLENGHIYFIPAENKNVILQASGNGKILFNNVDMSNLTTSIQNSIKDLNAFKTIFGSPTSSSAQISSRIASIEQTVQRLNQIEVLDGRLTLAEQRLATNNGSVVRGTPRVDRLLRDLLRRIEALESQLQSVGTSGRQSPCNPCLNGATCIPTIYGAVCYCTPGWEGPLCDRDVNECANFLGTELGCQNGATCVNHPGTYQCQCQNGFFGIHCTRRRGDCSSGSNWEMCGHGMCIDQHSGPNPYTCICDSGWQKNERSPTCMTDIDECSQYHTSCSINPPVMCINTQGSYVCGPCPSGYTGNGHQCMDINECLINNGGCSVSPMVHCTNTVGSRSCGPCPAGYMGDGTSCPYVGICHMNNGGCYPTARCVENPVIGQSFVQCICPVGYTGSGMGLHGCMVYQSPSGTAVQPSVAPGVNPCQNVINPCQNGGVCHYYGGDSYTCSCAQGYIGQTCATRSDPCLSQPCQNGGTCRATSSTVTATTAFTCTCSSEFTGDFCERQVESCGGLLNAEEGALRFPQTQSTYDHNTHCEWQMRTTAGKVLNISFSSFHLEGGSSCSYDYLEIRDGSDTRSPLLGRFCGDVLPRGGESILSTHNTLHLTFRSDHSILGLGFGLTWNSTEPVCGGVMQNQIHGTLTSPGYPGNYPHDRDCIWQIKAASLGKRLNIVFASFQLETHPNCSYDYLEIRDGLQDSAPILEKLCSDTTTPIPVTSSGPFLTVRFHSDHSGSGQGFLITYSEIPGVPGCGGLLTAATAIFSSPQHPQPYAHGLECDWLIRLPSRDDKISLSFLTFELESSWRGCSFDYLESVMGRFCGNNVPPSLKSSSSQMFVRFKSDESVAFGGFSAKYEAVCGGEATTPSGILRSPYYPNNYPKHRDCVYIISQAAGSGINLQFLDFDIEPGTDTSCMFDYLEIRDGDTENSTLIGHYCGSTQSAPPLITSSYNYLWLRFKTDGSVQNKGFLANYTSFETGCGGILRGSDGTISSPGHPEVYPHGVQCMWVIRGKPGQVVRLTWSTFNLESSSNCGWDFVEIYDNSTSFVNASLIGRYCGQDQPPVLTSTDTTLTVIFKSDHSSAFDGFMASYKFLNSSTSCGGNYFTEYGVIKSPCYPENYPNSRTCIWIITAPRGRQIELNITDFDMEEGSSSSGCRFDFLEIRNGPFSTSPLIGTFCGNLPPPTIIPSFSNSLYLKFKSDSSHTRKGFSIIWDATSTGCGGILTNSPSGTISSPNYPSPHGGGLECLWKIKVNVGSTVQINFVDMDIVHNSAGHSNCLRDRVEVFDGTTVTSRSLGKFCSEDHSVSIRSTGNSATIKLVVGVFGGTGRGFMLNYRAVCSTVLRGLQGIIESPNFPNPYPHNRNCTWVIEASKGNKVNISFSHVDIEAPYRGNCSYDFIQISEWERKTPQDKTTLGTYCGTNRPRLIASSKDTVSVSFVSDFSHARNGFRLEWVQHGCGGRIVGNYGRITSPGYPKRYATNVECIWQVTTEIGSKVKLSLEALDIEHSPNCDYDGLVVYGGPDETSPEISRICETISEGQVQREITSHGNNMFIKFYSDDYIPRRGFSASLSQVPGGCGATFKTSSGYIYSPNYPANYDHDEDCYWRILVDEGHVVELTFEEFDVAQDINCTNNYVTVSDSHFSNQNAELTLLKHCGSILPNPVTIRSTGSTMLVRLRTDGTTSVRKGFKARFAKGCGARLTGESGVITSPNFPGRLPSSINCSWIIESPDKRISLTFTHIIHFSRDDPSCNTSFLQVLDGGDYDAPSLYKACNGVMPPTLTSSGNAMIVHITGQHNRGHGFRAVYSQSSSACGGDLTATNGSFISPNYPNGYPSNVECIWTIKASVGNKVQLSFRRFELETSDFCNNDFVEIHKDSASGPLLGHYCGNEIPSNVTAAEQIWVLFRTDGEGQAAGFWADFYLLHSVELSGSSGAIASPMYPLSYTGTGTFTWRIMVNQSSAVQISFADYDLDPDEDDSCEYSGKIAIYDGPDQNSATLLSTCAQEIPDPVVSTGNIVYIEYYRKNWYNIFLLNWQQVQRSSGSAPFHANISGCGGNFSLNAGNSTTLTSPGFPSHYLPNLNCDWGFDAPAGSRIRLKIENLLLEYSYFCQLDVVVLYDGVRGLPTYELNTTLCRADSQNSTYLSSGRFLRVVFKTDESAQRSGFNFTLTTECGGYVRGTRGVISSPNYPNNYVASNCVWKIVVRPGRTIRLTFNSSFDIYSGGGQCSSDKLILRNGANEESPFLGSGRYCGNTAPAPLETFSNHLFVQFSSMTEGRKGFSFIYEEVSLGCGGNIELSQSAPSTIIQSPNFPQLPYPYTECEWVVQVPQGEAVQITFQHSFSVSYADGCADEGVEIRDGGTHISPSIGLHCNQRMPGSQKSTGNILYVRYYTNVAEPKNGFQAEVKIATCGGTHVTSYDGDVITSPGYPATYDINMDCLWTIKTLWGYSVILEFESFNLGAEDANCTRDKITITSNNVAELSTIPSRNWTICGQGAGIIPPTIETGSTHIQIRFISDGIRDQGTGIGFTLRYKMDYSACGQDVTAPTGIVQSPGYPLPYPHNRFCTWRILAPPGRRIRIEFLDFEMAEPVRHATWHTCYNHGFFEMQHDANIYVYWPFFYHKSMCGSTLPPPVESTSGKVLIYYWTDGSVLNRGFKFRYATDLPALCGGDLSIGQGNISSPNANVTTDTPLETNTVMCQWKTTTGEDNEIGSAENNGTTTIVTIKDLKIPSSGEKDKHCSHGSLIIKATANYGTKAETHCGSITNQKLYFAGASLFVDYLTSDWNSTFSLSYRTVACGGKVNDAERNITSLHYPSPYPVNTECIWIIDFPAATGNSGFGIKVNFFDLDMSDHTGDDGNCDRDFVIIRNGKYQTSPVLGKFCGSSMPNEITSMSNNLWIEFHSDENGDGGRRGFNIGLEQGSEYNCGGVLHTKLGKFRSPVAFQNSSRYQHNIECEWVIETVLGYTVNVVFHERFDIENSTNCTNDYVEVFLKLGPNWNSLGRFCGRQLPPSINTTSATVKVVFKSNENRNGDGFHLYWYSRCGGVFQDSTGIIRSAHFNYVEHQYSVNSGIFKNWVGWEVSRNIYQCDYVVEGKPEEYIMLKFLAPFEVEDKSRYEAWPVETQNDCPFVNVTVWEGNVTTRNPKRMRRPFCGTQIPLPYIVRGSAVISYNYRPNDHAYGFRIQYNKFECGGEITSPKVIRSPGHPFTTPLNLNCTWVVKAPQNKVVRFKFKFLEMEYNANCNYDYVKLYDGSFINVTKLIGSYCGNLTTDLPAINSKSRDMTIQSITDHSVQHGGFEAAIEFTMGEDQGCGGIKNLTSGSVTLTSLDTTAGNGTFLDCQWLLIAPEFKSIQLSFNSFTSFTQGLNNIVTNETCPFHFVEIHDGTGPFGQSLGKLCGNNLPPRIFSSANFIWIRFYSDGSASNYLRFSLTATSRDSPCGQLVFTATNTTQYLQSPGYPSNYENNVRCRCRIDAGGRYDEVDITFVEMDIEAASDCRKDRLEIRDVSSNYQTSEGITGPTLFSGFSRVEWRFRHLNLTMSSIMQDILYCGRETPPHFLSVGRSAELVFHSDGDGRRKGFKIGYKIAGCNKTYENGQGRIFSPKWPGHVPTFSNCLSSIRAPTGSQIALYFNSFNLPRSSIETASCTEAALEVRDSTPTGPILALYCGPTIPDPVFSNSSVVYLKFFTRGQFAVAGYDVTYTSTNMGRGCGGEIFHTGGSFTSPLYPNSYSLNSDCRWRIRVPGRLRIQIQFTNFMFGGDCLTDFLEILSMDSHDSSGTALLFSRYCSGDSPSIYTGATDMAVVRYKTSVNNTGSGWRATFKGVLSANAPPDGSQ